jgi:putative lipoprotein
MRRISLLVLILILCTVSCSNFSDSKSSETSKIETSKVEPSKETVSFKYPKIDKKDYPIVDGSTATLPLSRAIYMLTTGASLEEAESNIVHNKTTQSYFNLMNKENDIILAYSSSDEMMKAIEETNEKGSGEFEGETLTPIKIAPIGRDALVFLANKSNKVNNLSSKEIVDIYSGKITNWKELGGDDIEIKAFQRPQNSGSQNLVEKLVMKDTKMAQPVAEAVKGDMGELIEGVASYDNTANALGYSVYYYARNMKNDPKLKFMQVDDIKPNSDTIRSKEYPYINDFYVAIRADEKEDSNAYKLFEWLTSDNGQTVINKLGYTGIKDSDVKMSKYDEKRFIAKEDKEANVSKGVFDSDFLLALSGSEYEGKSGVLFLNNKLEKEKFVADLSIQEPKLIKKDSNILLSKVDKEGDIGDNIIEVIYSLKENKVVEDKNKYYYNNDMVTLHWVHEYNYEDKHYFDFELYDDDYNSIFVDEKVYTAFCAKNYIWTFKQLDNKNIANIYTTKGELFKSLDITNLADKIFIKSNYSFYNTKVIFSIEMEEEKTREFVFSEDGEFLLDTMLVFPKINETSMKLIGEGVEDVRIADIGYYYTAEKMLGLIGSNERYYLYSLETGEVIDITNVDEWLRYQEYEDMRYIFFPSFDGKCKIYNFDNNELVRSFDREEYNTKYNGYPISCKINGNKIHIADLYREKEFDVEVDKPDRIIDETTYAEYIVDGIYLITNTVGDFNILARENEKIAEGNIFSINNEENLYYYRIEIENLRVSTYDFDSKKYTTLVFKNGKYIYRYEGEENLVYADENFCIAKTDNHINFYDKDLKLLKQIDAINVNAD